MAEFGKKEPPAERVEELICIVCPNGCSLRAVQRAGGVTVTGNQCKRGEAFAVGELTAPRRTISSTVRTVYQDVPVLPVRVTSDIPKDRIFDVMKEINKACVNRPVRRGDVIIKNVCGLSVDVIATSSILSWKQRENTLLEEKEKRIL